MLLTGSSSRPGLAIILLHAHLATAHLIFRKEADHADNQLAARSPQDISSAIANPEPTSDALFDLDEDLAELNQAIGYLNTNRSGLFPSISNALSVLADLVSRLANTSPEPTTNGPSDVTPALSGSFSQSVAGTQKSPHPHIPVPASLEDPVAITTGDPLYSAISGYPMRITPGIRTSTAHVSFPTPQEPLPILSVIPVEPNTPVATPSDVSMLSFNPGGPNHRITTVSVSYSEMSTPLESSAEATILPLESIDPLETILPVAPAPTFSIFNQSVDGWNYTSHGSNDTLSSVSDGTTTYTSTQHITIMVTAHQTPAATLTYPSLDLVVSEVNNDVPRYDGFPTASVSQLSPTASILPIEENTASIDTVDFNATARDNIAVYYHFISNSTTNDTSLAALCQNPSINIINLPLINGFKGSNSYPIMTMFPGCSDVNSVQQVRASDLRSCPDLASSIQTCQSLGKKILISISNSTFANDGSTSAPSSTFTTPEEAKTLAHQLWNIFGSATSSQPLASLRPFGPASALTVDGFGIDDALSMPYYDVLAQSLRSHFSSDKNKTYYLSTSQACASPPSTKVADIVAQEIDFVYLRTQGAANSACAANLTNTVTEWNAALSEAGTGKINPKNSPASSVSGSANPTPALYIGSMAWPVDGTDGGVEVPYRDPVFVENVGGLYGADTEMQGLGGLAFWPGGSDMGNSEGWEGVEGYLEEVKGDMDK